MPVISYHEGLLERLQDAAYAEGYLDEAKSSGQETYQAALRNVAEAVARKAAANSPHNLGAKKQAFNELVAEYLLRPNFGDHPALNV